MLERPTLRDFNEIGPGRRDCVARLRATRPSRLGLHAIDAEALCMSTGVPWWWRPELSRRKRQATWQAYREEEKSPRILSVVYADLRGRVLGREV